METKVKTVKVSVNLSEDAVEALRVLSKENGITVTEVLRRAIGLEKYVNQVQKDNGKILIENSKGQLRELVFR